MSYGTSVVGMFRQVGNYTASVLEGAKPVNLPVLQSAEPASIFAGITWPGQRGLMMRHYGLAGVNDQFLLGEELKRAVPFGVNGVSKAAVDCRKHGDDRTHLMVVGCVIDFLANRKLRHRKLLLESSVRDYISTNRLIAS
jgi:hypothetical protein